MCAAVKTHIAIGQWQLVSYTGAALRSEALAQVTEDMQPYPITLTLTRARARARARALTLTPTR